MAENKFIEAMGFREVTFSENGATKLYSTGKELVNQIATAGVYRDRALEEVFADQEALYNEDVNASMRFIFYLRMITRTIKMPTSVTTKVQKGMGAKDESFKRLLWVAMYHYDLFIKNMWLLPFVGSWKDVWTLMFYDHKYGTNCIKHDDMFSLLTCGLGMDGVCDLVKKYMPSVKANSKCKTEWAIFANDVAKEFAHFLGIKDYLEYNKVKSSGMAHDWQKLISTEHFSELRWPTIPGKALSLMVNGKFLSNHNLEEAYLKWLAAQDVVKYTGYPFELANKVLQSNNNRIINKTCDLQFDHLVMQAQENGKITENVLVALDTSGSMRQPANGLTGISCGDIANSLALFFGRLNEGYFKNLIMMFDDTSYPFKVHGESFSDDLRTLPRVPCGGTNFQSVVEALKKIRTENPDIPLTDYPTTILCVSDMELNSTSYSWRHGSDEPTNYEYSVASLKEAFPSDFVDNMKFIWWNVASRSKHAFEGDAETKGCIMVSGFDGAMVSMLLGEEGKVVDDKGVQRNLTSAEIADMLLSQEVLNLISC